MSILIEHWQSAGIELGIEVVSPFQLVLQNGITLKIDLLIKNFGAEHGMLIVTDYNLISKFTDDIVNMGYGYSTMSEPLPKQLYNKENYIDVLIDWGWSGDLSNVPKWIK